MNNSSNGSGGGAVGVGGRAKYKLMSPAKLPITRSPCITIPPELSPTSFLDSPVFVPNYIKAEPSPTTGSFLRPHIMHESINPRSFSSSMNFSHDLGGSKANGSELKLQSGSTSSGLPVEASLGLAGMNPKPREQATHSEFEELSPTVASSIMGPSEVARSSGGLCLYTAVQLGTSNGNAPAESLSSILARRGDANNEVQVSPPQSDQKDTESPVVTDRVAEDGYNWRKYGQKLVKGGEYPRSYYKCTHPNCEVKKLFERAPDGQITEIIYKGRHDHPKPLPSRRISAGSMMPIQEEHPEKLNCQEAYNNDASNNDEPSPHTTNTTTNAEGVVPEPNNDSPDDENDPFSKRRYELTEACMFLLETLFLWRPSEPLKTVCRKMEMAMAEISTVVKPIREPRVVVQTISEVDILDDGYRWRKYGQKVVRGNPNPRSYYKCTSLGCLVRKHVERASHDPKAVITTYEGKHNHDVPSAKTSSHDASAAAPPKGDVVSLNLGVGINPGADRIVHDQHAWSVPGQARLSNSNFVMVQAPHLGALPGYVNGAMMYGSNHIEAHNVDNQSSNLYQQTMGRILMHP
ncbi:putative WRKY transcription factor 20 [Drosera capensis]